MPAVTSLSSTNTRGAQAVSRRNRIRRARPRDLPSSNSSIRTSAILSTVNFMA